MTTIPVTCAIHSDGSRVKSKIIGMGIDAFILHPTPSTVLKIPQLYGQILSDGTMIPEPDNQWANDLSTEKAIYERLDDVSGLARYHGASKDGLILEYYKNGCLEDYLQENLLLPQWSQRRDWIVQIIDVYAACHARNVLVCDIALRNLLLADDYTIRAIDFANSSLFPLEEVGELGDVDGYTSMVDVLHVTNVIYSLSSWKKFQVDCVRMEEWPKAEELPSTLGLPLGDVIARSWAREFKTLGELRQAVVYRKEDEGSLQ
jgi:serine/threonine protein kinase